MASAARLVQPIEETEDSGEREAEMADVPD
jgi:hypothetical protein